MEFDFKRCRALILNAVLAELEAGTASLNDVNRAQVSGIGLDVSPWHRRLCVALRNDDEKWNERHRYHIGDWKLYPLNCIVYPPTIADTASAIDFFGDSYDSAPESELRDVAHLICLAAAEALLDGVVAAKLQQLGIDAPHIVDDFPPHRCFEYVVTDEDNSIAANYCEIVIANRITARLM